MKPRVLVIYKKSPYEIYIESRKRSRLKKSLPPDVIRRLKRSHDSHHATLDLVDAYLKRKKLSYRLFYRGRKLKFRPKDLIISVGGDGTFLQAARYVTRQLILGVNSDPARSVGQFCGCIGKNFSKIMDTVLNLKAKVQRIPRLRIRINGRLMPIDILNDMLVCQRNPAAMSRYYLTIGRVSEEQRGSGLWIATAAGSSGGIHSAGGRVLSPESRRVQYRPRELYRESSGLRLRGSVLRHCRDIRVRSMMIDGMIYVDGDRFHLPFTYGKTLALSYSPKPLGVIRG